MKRNLYIIILGAVVLTALSVGLFGLSSARADDDENDKREKKEGLQFKARLSGAQEVTTPSGGVDTPASGMVTARFNADLSAVQVRLKVSDIENVMRAHFHCNRPGANGPITFGLFDPGTFVFDAEKGEARGTLTNADFTGADCVPLVGRPVNNIAALAFAMRDGLIYINVHTNDGEDPTNTGPGDFPGGEIRGQMTER